MNPVSQAQLRQFEERVMRSAHWVVAAGLAAASSGAAVAAEGLVPSASNPWPRWQGRLLVGTETALIQAGPLSYGSSGLKVGSASLLGDYYFARSIRGAGSAGGFRATSGVFLGARSSSSLLSTAPAQGLSGRAFNVDRRSINGLSVGNSADNGADPTPVPYLGLGYTGMAGKGGWGFSADLGVMALSPGSAVKLGRVFNGGQGLDDALRDMRLSPMLQLGVSYSF
jgi:hypothetical protein